MGETSKGIFPKNTDVECLRCGAMNITENKICGRCGASLPLVYDEEGKVFDWKQDPYYQAVYKKGGQGRLPRVNQVRWIMRLGVLLTAILIAIYILRHH
jgi:ribosomal protein L40E